MRLRLIAVGRLKKSFFRDAAAEYSSRIARLVPFEGVEVPASSAGEAAAPAEEGGRIRKALADGRHVILFDERGTVLSTAEFANHLSKWMYSSRDVDLVVGGAYGVDAETRASADEMWALSRLTLPHELARVVLLEAVYRALTIVQGRPYHHA